MTSAMTHLKKPILAKKPILPNPVGAIPTYWVFQIGGWSAFALLSYFSLNAWYNPGELIPTLHSIVQSVLGVLVSHPLRWMARWSWNFAMIRRIMLLATATLVAAFLWTVLRLNAFTLMTELPIDSEDWGGWIFGSITVFGCWTFCYHAIKYHRQWIEQQALSIQAHNRDVEAQARAQQADIKRLQAESLAREARLRMLHYQLNPHFFFNALNSVTALVRKDDKAAAMEMLARIGDFLRTALECNVALHHPLRDEIAIVESYLDIEKIRFGDRLRVVFAIAPAAQSVTIPHLLLQPLFENSIKHAVSRRLAPTLIRMEATVAGDWMTLRISDSCDKGGRGDRGEDSGNGGESPRIGLENIVERLQSIYSDDFYFDIDTQIGEGFAVKITLPHSFPASSIA